MVTKPTYTHKSHKSRAITKKTKHFQMNQPHHHPKTSRRLLKCFRSDFLGSKYPLTRCLDVWASLFVRRLDRHTFMCERRPNAYGTVAEHTARLTQGVLVTGTKSSGKTKPPVTFPFYWFLNGNPGILIMADNNPYKTGSYKLLYTVFLFIAHMSSSY